MTYNVLSETLSLCTTTTTNPASWLPESDKCYVMLCSTIVHQMALARVRRTNQISRWQFSVLRRPVLQPLEPIFSVLSAL